MTTREDASQHGVPSLETWPGTPLALEDPLSQDALDTIEFAAALELVAGLAAGEGGRARVRARRPSADVTWVERELALVEEMTALFRRGEGVQAEPVPALERALARLRIEGSVLDARELQEVAALLDAGAHVHAELARVAPQAPGAAALMVPQPPVAMRRRLEQSIGPDGEVLDTASPALAAARREARAARQRLVRRLESVLRSLEGGAQGEVTVRGGRYVIPVRRSLRSRPDGIIHDESASQETLFVEPSEAVALGNALTEAQVAEEREVLRVLRELTDQLRPAQAQLRDVLEMCLRVDDLVARARWAAQHDATAPAVAAAPAPLDIRNGRHPLLLAGSVAVVPFDLALDAGERTLLVSGPNTGGKTVLLKAVALCAALAQAGIVPPVGAGSRLPVFGRLAADIGDRQSIAASLSTFSAHVRTLAAILDQAGDDALVLLDEIGSGTDPAEGTALAAAAITALTRRGALTLVTTHLGKLKSLAGEEPGVVNASLDFDAATLAPSYRFRKGVPGRSYGLAIARRLGIAGAVLDDAEARVPEAERNFDALVAAVELRQRAVEQREAEAAGREATHAAEAERLAAREASVQARDEAITRRERDADKRARAEARRYLLDARRTVEAALAEAQGASDEARARQARRLLEDAIQGGQEQDEEAMDEAPGPAGPGADLEVGAAVRTDGGLRGELLELRGDGKAVVRVGAMKLVLDAASLSGDRSAPREVARPAPSLSLAEERGAGSMEVDLRGMTGDEAEVATLAALDAAILAEHPFLRVIHGMGTGVVRERVRKVAAQDRRVARYEFAPRNQGGAGVTIVEFR